MSVGYYNLCLNTLYDFPPAHKYNLGYNAMQLGTYVLTF